MDSPIYNSFNDLIVNGLLEVILSYYRENYAATETIQDLHNMVQTGYTVVSKPKAAPRAVKPAIADDETTVGDKLRCEASKADGTQCTKPAFKDDNFCALHIKVRDRAANPTKPAPKKKVDDIANKLVSNPAGPIRSRGPAAFAGSLGTSAKNSVIVSTIEIPGTTNVYNKVNKRVFRTNEDGSTVCIGKLGTGYSIVPLNQQEINIVVKNATYEEGELDIIDEEAFEAGRAEASKPPPKPTTNAFGQGKPLGLTRESVEVESTPSVVVKPVSKMSFGGAFSSKRTPVVSKEPEEEGIPEEKQEMTVSTTSPKANLFSSPKPSPVKAIPAKGGFNFAATSSFKAKGSIQPKLFGSFAKKAQETVIEAQPEAEETEE